MQTQDSALKAKNTSNMSQNIYDQEAFFSNYSKLPRALHGTIGASEWPLLRQMLPRDLTKMSVLDLGCGEGWFSRWAVHQGASRVLGMDVSANMLDRARRDCHSLPPTLISFQQTDMDIFAQHPPAPDKFDLIFSALAIHYASDQSRLFAQLFVSLKPGGAFVFSVEHPIFTAPRMPGFVVRGNNTNQKTSASVVWPLDDYFRQGPREVQWLASTVRKSHHTVSAYFSYLRRAGFDVEAMDEWGGKAQGDGCRHPDWPEDVIPRFLLVAARKPLRTAGGRSGDGLAQ